LVRLAARQEIVLCPNYFVTESALTLPERNIYTAREIVQMVPLFGQAVYQQFRQQNGWTNQFLPNGAGAPAIYRETADLRQWPQQIAERPLKTGFGAWLERWERQRKIEKLRYQQNGSKESNFSATICKGHFNAHQKQILTAYQQQLTNGHQSSIINRQSKIENSHG
jgi:hypothetical protein